MQVLLTFSAMLRRFRSLRGGLTDLYIAGRNPVLAISGSNSQALDVYQATPNPSTLERMLGEPSSVASV